MTNENHTHAWHAQIMPDEALDDCLVATMLREAADEQGQGPEAESYVYNYARYFNDGSYTCSSLEDAVKAAACDLDTGDGWPVSITRDGLVLWKSFVGQTSSSLASFAKQNGIDISAFGLW